MNKKWQYCVQFWKHHNIIDFNEKNFKANLNTEYGYEKNKMTIFLIYEI